MSWQLYAHWLDRKAKQGVDENPIADLDLGRGAGALPELLGLKVPDASAKSLLDAGTKVGKAKVEETLRECCKRYLEGEDILGELQFLATILMRWKRSEKSIFFLMN
jgi:hypothetical protein